MWPEKEHSKVSGRSKSSIDQLNQAHENIGPQEGTAYSRDVGSSRPVNLKVKGERNEYQMRTGSGKGRIDKCQPPCIPKAVESFEIIRNDVQRRIFFINQCPSIDTRFQFEIFDGKMIPGVKVFYS